VCLAYLHTVTRIHALLSILGTSLFARSIIAISFHTCSQTGARSSRHVTQRPAVIDHLVVTVLRVYDAKQFCFLFSTTTHQNYYCCEQNTLFAADSCDVSIRIGKMPFLSALFEGFVGRKYVSSFCYFARHASLIFMYPVFGRTSVRLCSSYVRLYVYICSSMCVCVFIGECSVDCLRAIGLSYI